MQPLGLADRRHLEAAQGWLGLGNLREARAELEQITPNMRAHPEALQVNYEIYAAARNWESAAGIGRSLSELVPDSPFGFIQLAYALHELKRTQEAWDVLLAVVEKFPKEWIMRYNLACYACQLGNMKEGWGLLLKARDMAGRTRVNKMALEDPDLKPLWKTIEND